MITDAPAQTRTTVSPAPLPVPLSAPDSQRNYLGNRYVYVKFSPRAHGMSVGVNLNTETTCNLDCVYCDAFQKRPKSASLDLEVLYQELRDTLQAVRSGELAGKISTRPLPPELAQLRMVAISGEGEPTLCPQFVQAIESIVHVRAQGRCPYFKIALLTNGSTLHQPEVRAGLRYLTREDEVWIKLDAGSSACFDRVNQPQGCRYETVIENILQLGRERPVIIQSMFPLLRHQPPPQYEIDAYAQRLNELKAGGAQISLVQVHSVSRQAKRRDCTHLPLRNLSAIARTVRSRTGLRVEVF